MSLPNGTVTFLLTDIEGSTKLWEEHPEEMRSALARHDQLLRKAIEDNNGVVFKTVGDAFCAAFAIAPDALYAVIAAQLALSAEIWPEPLTLKVRMALHTGAAELRDKDYFGSVLNRVARLLGVGHGGQTLLSLATQELTRDTLPVGVSLEDIGVHSLRDLARPEQVFQLLHSDLPSGFPPLKSLHHPGLPNNLPQQLTSFIGREKEIEDVKTLLGKTTRLLTLSGTGGCGKTRLGLQVIADVLEHYPDGVWLIELAPLDDPELVSLAVASVLGVKEQAGKTLNQTLTEYLQSRKLLLLLDNCEHLLAACATLVAVLLRVCPQLQVLATSRERLGVTGEQTYRVPSLSLPDPQLAYPYETLSQFEAVQLFIERALLVQPDFAVTNSNAPALAQLCYRLDGIPLAIELAAARAHSLAVEDINQRLDNRFRLLTGGDRTALPRQQTLRALIDWSYDLLNGEEKRLLMCLSVFAGGWTLEAAEQVCSGESLSGENVAAWEMLDLLSSLVDKSLVIAETGAGSTRYRLLETVRQYACERLQASGERESMRMRHGGWCLSLVQEVAPKLRGPEQAALLEQLEREYPNLHTALEGFAANALEGWMQLQLAACLEDFWYLHGYLAEGRRWLEAALSREGTGFSTSIHAQALGGAGGLARTQGEVAAARALFQEALSVYRSLGDQKGIARTLMDLGSTAYEVSDYAIARTLWEESLAIHTQIDNRSGIAHTNHMLGIYALSQHDAVGARQRQEASLILYRQLGDRIGIAEALSSLARVARHQGDLVGSRALNEESLAIRREMGLRVKTAESLLALSATLIEQGDLPAAQPLLIECQGIFHALGDRWGMAETLHQQADIGALQGDRITALVLYKTSLTLRMELGHQKGILDALEEIVNLVGLINAVQLMATCQRIREIIGVPQSAEEKEVYEVRLAQRRTTLGEEAFAAAWAEGYRMTLEQGVECAMEAVVSVPLG